MDKNLESRIEKCLTQMKFLRFWRRPEQLAGKPFNYTYLEMACMYNKGTHFLEWMIHTYPDVNFNKKNPANDYCTPLHLAAAFYNAELFEKLHLWRITADVNCVNKRGNTVLHCLVESRRLDVDSCERCLEAMLRLPHLEVNRKNRSGKTAIVIAAEQGKRHLVEQMLASQRFDLLMEVNGQRVGAILQKHLPRLVIAGLDATLIDQLARTSKRENAHASLFQTLASCREDEFIMSVREALSSIQSPAEKMDFLMECDGWQTLIQLACERKLCKAVEFLVELEVGRVLASDVPRRDLPLHIIAGHEDMDRIKLFLDEFYPHTSAETGNTVLHYFVRNKQENENSIIFFKRLLEEDERWLFQVRLINRTNKRGETPLYIAMIEKKLEFADSLLKYGAFMGSVNDDYSKNPMEEFSTVRFQKYLDSCISEVDVENEKIIKFNYSNLILKSDHYLKFATELTVPRQMCGNKTKSQFLVHPVINSLIHHKWSKCKWYLYLNDMIYLLFTLCLSAYIYTFFIDRNTPVTSADDSTSSVSWHTIYRWCTLVLLIYAGCRFSVHLFVSPRDVLQFCSLFEIVLLVLSSCVIIGFPLIEDRSVHEKLAISSVVVTYTGILLFSNHHPDWYIHVVIFRKITFSYIKMLGCYFALLIGFSLIFFIVFPNSKVKQDSGQLFSTIQSSLFYTIVLNSGGIDAKDLPFERHSVVSHLSFIAFNFLVVVVLMNLLSSFAVTDTQLIRKDAEIHVCIKQVESMYSLELFTFKVWRLLKCNIRSCNMLLSSSVSSDETSKRRQSVEYVFPDQITFKMGERRGLMEETEEITETLYDGGYKPLVDTSEDGLTICRDSKEDEPVFKKCRQILRDKYDEKQKPEVFKDIKMAEIDLTLRAIRDSMNQLYGKIDELRRTKDTDAQL